MAWLAEHLPQLRVRDRVLPDRRGRRPGRSWLQANGIDARAYSGRTDPAERLEIEDALRADQVKVVVATSALGMGFDKPDLPSSSISSRPTRRSPTTSRSAGPAAPWTGPRWCCCAAPRTAPSGNGSPPPPSHPATTSRPS